MSSEEELVDCKCVCVWDYFGVDMGRILEILGMIFRGGYWQWTKLDTVR